MEIFLRPPCPFLPRQQVAAQRQVFQSRTAEENKQRPENVGVRDGPEKCPKTERCGRYCSREEVSVGVFL